MKLKATGLLLVMAMLLGIAALPASADVSVGAHVGAFMGQADVGKASGICDNGSQPHVKGGGIGLLPGDLNLLDDEIVNTDAKNAYWRILAGTVVDVPNLVGTAELCGKLTAPLQGDPDGAGPLPFVDMRAQGIGASCASTKGYDGRGEVAFPTKPEPLYITNLGWKATVGGLFIVTGDVGGQKGKKADLLLAQVQALSDTVLLGCIQKTQGNKSDPDPFTVVATYEIIPGAGGTQPKKGEKKR